jgi:hypothetical protein
MTRTWAAIAAALAVMLLASPGLAETPAVPAPLLVAAAVAPTARQLELAHRYIVAIHYEANAEASMKAALPTIMTMAPGDAVQRKGMIEDLELVMRHMRAEMAPQFEQAVAETYSVSELEDAVAFYETSAGQGLIAKQPRISGMLAPIMREFMTEWMSENAAKTCASLGCTPDVLAKMCEQMRCAKAPYPVMLTWPVSPAPTARSLDLARRYMAATNDLKKYEALLKASMAGAPSTGAGGAMEQEAAAMLARRQAKLAPYRLAAVAETYSEPELQAVVEFYESPTGHAIIAKQPDVAAKLAVVSRTFTNEMLGDLMAKACVRMKCPAPPKAPPRPAPKRF